ncbi:MAG TPA: hypothetical protein PLJ99_00040 [Kiritimatiellia bacterium]|nr:hypothetical protein [Kiritimatiellia bacterium]HRX06610.1 hypothetical protein [Kiritimatiellia bacterium]
MFQRFSIPALRLVAAWLATSGTALAADRYGDGFYTRGVEAAMYMDQGDAVLDPFYVPAKKWAFLPRTTLTLTHEDNLFLDPDEPREGTTVRLAPGLLAIWGRPADNHVYADYGLSIPVHQSEQELDDRPSHLLRLGVVYRTGKSQANLQGGFRHMEDVDAELGARVAKRDLFADLSVEHRVSGKSSLGALARAERHDFDAEEYSDYDRYYGALRCYRRASAKSQVFVQGGFGRDEPRSDGGEANAADFFDLSLGLRGKQSPRFHLGGRAGVMWRQYDAADRPDSEHWIAALNAESTPFGLTTFTAELQADVRPAVDAAGVDAVDRAVIFGASRRLFMERLRGTVSVTFGQVEYIGGGTTVAADEPVEVTDGQTDDYWGFTAGLDFWTRWNCSLGAAYSYMERTRGGAEDDGSYDYGRWTLRASWNY